MTWPTLGRYATYAAEWFALVLAWRHFNRQRPLKPLPQGYLILAGLLAVLQWYGESWHP